MFLSLLWERQSFQPFLMALWSYALWSPSGIVQRVLLLGHPLLSPSAAATPSVRPSLVLVVSISSSPDFQVSLWAAPQRCAIGFFSPPRYFQAVISFNRDLAEQGLLNPTNPPHINQSLKTLVCSSARSSLRVSAFLGMACYELNEIQMQLLWRGRIPSLLHVLGSASCLAV